MTVLELTRLWIAQDDRWSEILTHAQNTRHPLAQQGVAFFMETWRPMYGNYFETVVARYDSAAKAPMRVVRGVLDKMSDVIYPAARRAGFSDRSFVFPDIAVEKGGPATTVAGYSWMYW